MVKMKHLQLYKSGDVPDHIIQEVDDLMNNLICAMAPLVKDVPPGYILSAFNRIHAAMIFALISESPEELKKAALLEAKGLILNIEDISKVKIFDTTGEE